MAVVSCGRHEPSNESVSTASQPDVVARVGDEAITREVFEAEWQKRGLDRISPKDVEKKREWLLSNMIETRAALVRARESGFDKSPEMTALIDELIANRYQEKHFAGELDATSTVSSGEALGYFEGNPEAFSQPPAVRIGVIKFSISSKATAERREQTRLVAENLLHQAINADDMAFAQLVLNHSDDQSTRYIGGDAGWLKEDSPDSRWPPEVIRAAFALQTPAEIPPLIACPDAFYIVRLKERRPAGIRPFEEVVDFIQNQLQQARLSQRQEAVRHELTNGLSIQINRAILGSVTSSSPDKSINPPSLPGS